MLGNRAMGSCTMATIPTITMMIEMTIDTMGRLMKNFDMRQAPRVSERGGRRRRRRVRRDVGLGCDGHAVAHLLQSLDDHPLPGLGPVENHPVRAGARSGGHVAD